MGTIYKVFFVMQEACVNINTLANVILTISIGPVQPNSYINHRYATCY